MNNKLVKLYFKEKYKHLNFIKFYNAENCDDKFIHASDDYGNNDMIVIKEKDVEKFIRKQKLKKILV